MSETGTTSLSSLAADRGTGGAWWVSVGRALDELQERLVHEGALNEGPSGAFAEAVSREPGLFNVARRASADRITLVESARRLRQRLIRVAGDAEKAPIVCEELVVLARQERRYTERARRLFWESFNRDIGGG